jgi:hypothetical protein
VAFLGGDAVSGRLGALRWPPRFVTYRAAVPRHLAGRFNRYPGVVIGAEVQVRGRCFGVVWGRP